MAFQENIKIASAINFKVTLIYMEDYGEQNEIHFYILKYVIIKQ